jgi:hypothetical protein
MMLNLAGTRITEAGVTTLRQALPHSDIIY